MSGLSSLMKGRPLEKRMPPAPVPLRLGVAGTHTTRDLPPTPSGLHAQGGGSGIEFRKNLAPPAQKVVPPSAGAEDDVDDVPAIFDGMDLSADNIQGMKTSYAKNGFIRIQIADDVQCREFIMEMWNDIILQQPWIHKIQLFSKHGKNRELHLTNPADEEEYLQIITSRLDPKVRKMMEKAWPLHRGFGACCDPGVFFSKCALELRQNRHLYTIVKHLLGYKRLWADVNRKTQKLTTQGMSEFLHFDFNPFARTISYPSGISGKFCASPGQFVCVPCTHTPEFFEEFVPLYRPLYPAVKETDSKFGLAKTVEDPLHLLQRKRNIPIPAGVIILWNNLLCHGQEKTPHDAPMEMGQYLGFFPAGSRARYFEKCGVDEREDRVQAYLEGRAPILWPSFDKIQFYPKRFDMTPSLMKVYLDKLPAGHPMRGTRTNGCGNEVDILLTPKLVGYKPLPMTKLGKRLLGLEYWPVSKRARVQDDLARGEGGEGGEGSSSGQKRARGGKGGKGV